jgi:hypothetical protein
MKTFTKEYITECYTKTAEIDKAAIRVASLKRYGSEELSSYDSATSVDYENDYLEVVFYEDTTCSCCRGEEVYTSVQFEELNMSNEDILVVVNMKKELAAKADREHKDVEAKAKKEELEKEEKDEFERLKKKFT